MARTACDGAGLIAAFRAAAANLEAHVDEINALNVFPVPDGDTGTNMAATVRAALEEAEKYASEPADAIAQGASFGALMGARGNSGVITSQILAGIAHGMAGKRHFNGLDLAHALSEGAKQAYKAVVKPVEGTILTVIRESSAAAVTAAEIDSDVVSVLAATVEAAEKAVAKTPSLLPILREAHVVDSGGQGLLRLFEGALNAARGGAVGAVPPTSARRAGAVATTPAAVEEAAWGYETVFLLSGRPGAHLDVEAIRSHLESIGDSVLVAGDGRLVKVHIHNERPDEVIAYGLGLGALTRITVENLDHQASDVREARASAFVGVSEGGAVALGAAAAEAALDPGRVAIASTDGGGQRGALDAGQVDGDARARTRFPLGVVAVAPSSGLADVLAEAAIELREYGVLRVVTGGQAHNPSTGELLAAVEDCAADQVLVLPNNPNVVLAARQVAGMVDRPVEVVPTRNVAEGIAALFELDPTRSAADNAGPMTKAGRAVQTLSVTDAVRDATIGGRKVRKGQVIVLDPDDGLMAVDNDPTKAVLGAVAGFEPGYELVTVYYGEDATLDDAETIARQIGEQAEGAEIRVVHGGQPHYRFLISAE